jgi:hypothetical protein
MPATKSDSALATSSDINATRKQQRMLKAYLITVGCLALFILGTLVAWKTRQYQIKGQTMPNWKGGQMTISEGYRVAIACFMSSIGCFVFAIRFWRRQPTRDSGASTDDDSAS